MARRGGLGKGLGALIPPGTEFVDTERGGLEMLPVASVRPNRYQPREYFDEEAKACYLQEAKKFEFPTKNDFTFKMVFPLCVAPFLNQEIIIQKAP